MATNSKIIRDSQKLITDSPYIELFAVDLSKQGGTTHYLAGGTLDGSNIEYDSNEYTPIPIEIKGMERSADGQMPRPTLTVSNVTRSLLPHVINYNDFLNCTVTVTRLFKKYLDGESKADTNAHFPSESFKVNRKLKQNPVEISFELIAPLDLEHIKLPRERVSSICSQTYRVWNGVSFDYTNASCPYTNTDSTSFYTVEGVETTEENDKCGKKLVDCKLRFGTVEELPMKGFPGVGLDLGG